MIIEQLWGNRGQTRAFAPGVLRVSGVICDLLCCLTASTRLLLSLFKGMTGLGKLQFLI